MVHCNFTVIRMMHLWLQGNNFLKGMLCYKILLHWVNMTSSFLSFCRFCGFESDVVIIKRQFHNINLSGRFVNVYWFQVNDDEYTINVNIISWLNLCYTRLKWAVEIFSYIGKGIIQASPQAVMDAVKNPRTRYTYDDSLKVNTCLFDDFFKLLIE